MQNISCNVTNCSHNKEMTCYSNRLNIVGKNSYSDENTCCGSFLDKNIYGALTNNVYNEGNPCDCLICNVNTCKHNNNSLCSLNSINVSGSDVKLYTQTNCESFCNK